MWINSCGIMITCIKTKYNKIYKNLVNHLLQKGIIAIISVFVLPDPAPCHHVMCLRPSYDLLSALQGNNYHVTHVTERQHTHTHLASVDQSFRPGPLFVKIRANPQLLE